MFRKVKSPTGRETALMVEKMSEYSEDDMEEEDDFESEEDAEDED